MQSVRFVDGLDRVYGIVDGVTIRQIDGSPLTEYVVMASDFDLAHTELLPPCTPSKIVCLALNYRAHASTTSARATFSARKHIIATGTPENPGLLTPGDTIEVDIEQVGRLKNTLGAPSG